MHDIVTAPLYNPRKFEDSLEQTSANILGTVFRRFCATWKNSITQGEFSVIEKILYITFWLLTRVSPTDRLLNYWFNVSRFWQLNYFSKFANLLGLYTVV